MNRVRAPRDQVATVTTAELQQLLLYDFIELPPDVRKRGSLLPPNAWQSGTRLERKAVWCADS